MSITYEIRPCVETDEGEVRECPPAEAEFWTIYCRGEDGGGIAVCDTLTREDAESACGQLQGLQDEADRMRTALSIIARLQKDGEDGFDLTNDDAVDSLHSCIELARRTLAEGGAA